jgi:hypothetical protein
MFNFSFLCKIERSNAFFSNIEYLNTDYLESLRLFFILNKIIKSNYIKYVTEPAIELLKNVKNTDGLHLSEILMEKVHYVENIEKINNHFNNMIYIRDFILCYLVFEKYYLIYDNYDENEFTMIKDKYKKLLFEFIDLYVINSFETLDIDFDNIS